MCSPEMVTRIARVCHAANNTWNAQHGDIILSWEACRGSAENSVSFLLANPEAPASALHDVWMADKLSAGWVYREFKDAAAKTHPCLVPFDALPEWQQAKDRLFSAIVRALR
jgi:RyR domain